VASTFADSFRIIRKRVLAFVAVFFGAAMIGLGTCWYVSDAKSDPGPIVYLFPVSFAIIIGTFPALAYFLNRWVTAFDVRNCPACETFLWPTTLHATTVAIFGRCSRCWCRLVDPPETAVAKET
jgi:apolipoprotein N-acyltransferase